VWRVEVELPQAGGAPRRRVSKTVNGTRADAEQALESLRVGCVEVAAERSQRRTGKAVRTRGTGSISGRGLNRWLLLIEGPPDPITGRRRRYSRTVEGSRKDAEGELAQLRVQVDSGARIVATNARTVRAACEVYLRDALTERTTQRTDRSAINRLCATLLPGGAAVGEMPLSRLDWQTIERIYAAWEPEVSAQGRARYASTVSKVLEHVKRLGWISSNPARDARRPRVPTHRPDVPAQAHVRDALTTAKEHDYQIYAYVLALATIGCRRGELLAVQERDVDLARRVVTIRAALADGGPGVGVYYKATKRNDWRDVPLTEQLVEVLTELRDRRRAAVGDAIPVHAEAFVFSDDIEGLRWLRPDSMSHRWLATRGVSHVTFAMLRRYVATQLLDATNGDYRTVASITGNSEETLRRWYDAGPNIEKKAAIMSLKPL
jgi:integrase